MITISGDIGLIDVHPASYQDEKIIVLVRKGAAAGDKLSIRALNAGRGAPAGQVMWKERAVARATAWGTVAFDANTKPIGNHGCWRITRNDGPADDPGIIVDLG